MAAPMSRLFRQISPIQRKFLYERYFPVATAATVNCLTVRRFSNEQKFRFESQRSNLLTYAAIISACGFGFYTWKDRCQEYLSGIRYLVPTVHAVSIDKPRYRDKYNFIADVVDVSAVSVVHIEIKDQRVLDFFTGKPAVLNSGSGFIISSDGLILTNAHVVFKKPNTTAYVRLSNGETYPGIVEHIDFASDLATVRIKAKNLPAMKLGTSSDLRPGEFVVAIGSPLSLDNTITSGVVSNAGRHSEELGLHKTNMKYIQTDAAITFGNSGGPLVNLNGEAIGINAMKVTPGISFAIPIDYAKEFLKSIEDKAKGVKKVADGKKRRYMGITMVTLTPSILCELQNKIEGIPMYVKHGVLVYKVVSRSPAEEGGLLPGDIITHINSRPIRMVEDVYAELENSTSNRLIITIIRNKIQFNLTVQPEEV